MTDIDCLFIFFPYYLNYSGQAVLIIILRLYSRTICIIVCHYIFQVSSKV